MANYIQRTATVTLANGIKKRIKARGATEKEAIKKLERLKMEYEMGLAAINSNTLFDRWADEWLETYKKPSVTDSTLKNIKIILKNYYSPALGNIPLSNIKTMDIQKCLNEMQDLSKSYISKAYNIIFSIFDKAVLNGLLGRNPVLGAVTPKGKEKANRRALTDEERHLFLQAIDKFNRGIMLAMTFACGLRPGEVRALKWNNLDLKKNIVKVTHTVEDGKTTLKPPKSSAGVREIPIPQWYADKLKKLPQSINSDDFVFFGNGATPISERRYKRAWLRCAREMDILAGAVLYRSTIIEHAIDQKLTPYYLRHTYATSLAEKGVDIKTAQYLLGHADIKMTANIYTHVTQKMLDEARGKIDAI